VFSSTFKKVSYPVVAVVVSVLVGGCGSKAKEQGEPLALMPGDARLLGRVDVARLRQTQLKDKLLALRDRHEELRARWQGMAEKTGFDPLRDLDTVLFALMPRANPEQGEDEQVVAVAVGRFNQPAITSWFKDRTKGAATEKPHGKRVIVHDDSAAMAFVDSRTLVFGDLPSVERVLDLADGKGKSLSQSPMLLELTKRVKPNQVVSVVLTIPEEVRKRAEESPLKSLTSMIISLDFAAGMDLDFQGDCPDEKESKSLAERFNGTIKELLESPLFGSLGMGALIAGLKAHNEGKVLVVRGNVPPQQLDSIIRRIEELARGKLAEMPRLPLTTASAGGLGGVAASMPASQSTQSNKGLEPDKGEGFPSLRLVPPGEGTKKKRPSLLGQ